MRNTLKKSLAIIVALALCLTAFMGCLSVSAADANTVKVTGTTINVGDATATATIKLESTGFAAAMLDVSFTGLSIAEDEDDLLITASSSVDDVTEDGAVYSQITVQHNSQVDGEASASAANESGTIRLILDAAGTALGWYQDATVTITFNTAALAAGTYEVKVTSVSAGTAGTYDPTTGTYSGDTETLLNDFTVENSSIVVHAHDYSIADYDATGHWSECICGDVDGFETHTLGEATEAEDGKWYQSCVCGYSVEVDAPVVGVTHTVTFVDADGTTVLDTQKVADGAAAVAPTDPTSETADTYFVGWDKDFSNITADTTVTAQYHTVSIRLKSQALAMNGVIELILKIGADDGETDSALESEYVKEFGVLVWKKGDSVTDYTYDETKAVKAVYNTTNNWHVLIQTFSTEMSDIIKTRAYVILNNGTIIYGEKGNAEQALFETSICSYANNRINKGATGEEYDLLAAMLNYGAYCQIYFEYEKDNLANAILPEEDRVLPDVSCTATSSRTTDGKENVKNVANTRLTAAALQLDEVIRVNYGITVHDDDASNISEVRLLVWNEEDYQTAKNSKEGLVADSATTNVLTEYSSGKYRASSFDIMSTEMRKTLYARGYIVYSDGSTAYTQITLYSAEVYATSKISGDDSNLANAAKAMMIYGDAAVAYFE